MKFNRLIPELSVSSLDESKKFYTCILGFKIEYERPEKKFAFLSFQGAQIMIEEINNTWKTGELEKPFGRGINFQIETDDIEKLAQRLKEKNIVLFKELKESKYRMNDKIIKQKEFLVQDPDGYLLRFCE